jgi:hypothetical protein
MSRCDTYADCTDASKYCAALLGSPRGICRPCLECAQNGDANEGECPERCDAYSPILTNSSVGVFAGDFTYWQHVSSSAPSHALPKGCVASADANSNAFGSTKWYTKCSTALVRRDGNRFCDISALTRVEPFYQCIASSHTNYCGTNTPSFCLATSYFDCCPVRPGPLAGACVGTAVGILMIVYYIIRVVYRKRVNKFRATNQVVVAANKFKRALRRKSEEGDRAAAESADAAERGDAPAPSK